MKTMWLPSDRLVTTCDYLWQCRDQSVMVLSWPFDCPLTTLWLPFDNPLTALWQPCDNPVMTGPNNVTVQWLPCDCLWEPCDNAVTTLWCPCDGTLMAPWQSYDSSVMALWWPRDNHVMALWRLCDSSLMVLWQLCDRFVMTLWQPCDLINTFTGSWWCNRHNNGKTIYSTENFISMNLLQMSCLITRAWSFLTSKVVEAVWGQKHHILTHTLHFNSTSCSSLSASSAYQRFTKKCDVLWHSASISRILEPSPQGLISST